MVRRISKVGTVAQTPKATHNKDLNQEKQESATRNQEYSNKKTKKWKELYEKANQRAADLEHQRDEEREPPSSAERSGGRLRMQDFEDIIKGAFPNLRLMQDSLETVYYGLQNYRALMQILARIVYEQSFNGRNPIKNARKWREDRFDKEWQIYFCKESGLVGDKVLALIGDKNSQDNDTDWLRANPPKSCL